MTFVTALALAIGVLVVAPYLAHRLRRRRAEERAFAAAWLVEPAPPKARRRSRLEDRALFATRAAAVLALAVLGASPLVRCSRLSLQRSGGASVAFAIVVDDSMSMRARTPGTGKTRFDRAKDGARELLASAREGDAVAVVLAGSPARVALAATTDLSAARAAIDGLAESDRATDLDGALALARGLIGGLPQVDRRIVVLSDMADGREGAPPLGEGSAVPVWFALPDLATSKASDCALMTADRAGTRVRAIVLCSEAPTNREVVLAASDKPDVVLARAPLPNTAAAEVTLTLPNDEARDLVARITGEDAIAADDEALAVPEAGPGAIAVVADATRESVPTGGAPVTERALAALDVPVQPVPDLPDRPEDLAAFTGILLDDPPGLTPEQRRALGAFFDSGGVVLLAVGPRAAAAPLGATLEPMLSHAVTWGPTDVKGADPSSATGSIADTAEGTRDLAPLGRASLDPEDANALEKLLAWSDGAPLVGRRAVARGEAWVVTLPFSVQLSDLPIRRTFLALLEAFTAEARARAAPRRTQVGVAWSFPGAHVVLVQGPHGPISTTRDGSLVRAIPPLVGAYRVQVDGQKELRVASPVERELDFRPRAAAPPTGTTALGDSHASVDISSAIALLLLLLVAFEMGLRVWAQRHAEPA